MAGACITIRACCVQWERPVMPALQWLREKVHFHLPEQDVKAIRDFALLYSFFEAKALNEVRPA